uniref:Uncharacterized protein n=1 Tax=Opuntia streptacantha TaxID=393608 RepID=A0A7C8Z8D2_OPUST
MNERQFPSFIPPSAADSVPSTPTPKHHHSVLSVSSASLRSWVHSLISNEQWSAISPRKSSTTSPPVFASTKTAASSASSKTTPFRPPSTREPESDPRTSQ